MKKIKHIVVALFMFLVATTPVTASAMPLTQFGAPCTNQPILLTIPSWYRGLQCDGKQPQITELNNIWVIALNVVEALIAVTAYVAVGYIIWAGFKYMKSRGDPGQLTEAKNAITEAVIGLGIALASTAIVLFIRGIFN